MREMFLALIVFLAHCLVSAAENSPYRITTRSVPEYFKGAYEFLEFIKFPEEPQGVFDAQLAPHWDIPSFMNYISTKGVDFYDVNSEVRRHESSTHIEKSLSSRSGATFVTFAHLANIYSTPYKQYSELKFKRKGEDFIVDIGNYQYQLTFRMEKGQLRLVKCDYLTLEGD